MFKKYYDSLLNILPAGDLFHYFVTNKIISLIDNETVIRCLQREAAKLVLDNISVQLQNGNNKIFYKMLLIMSNHRVVDLKELSQEIRSKLPAEECEDHMNSSDGQGN